MRFFIDQAVKVPTMFGQTTYYFGGILQDDIIIPREDGNILFASKGEVILKKNPTEDSSNTYAPLSGLKAV